MAAFRPFNYKSNDTFKNDLFNLSPSVPFADDVSFLARPVALGSKTLPNSIAIHPMEGADGETDGRPGELTLRRYRRFASGGAGLMWFEATAVVPEGRANPRQLHITKDNVDSYRRLRQEALAEADRAGFPKPFTVLQLTHSGRQSSPNGKPEPIIACPNDILDRVPGRVITDTELDWLKDKFVEAAELAATAGFDAVDIKACHGYLLGELLTARTRPGKYGGPFENRIRFMVETVDAIAARLGGAATLASRYGMWDCVPGGWGVDDQDYHKANFAEPITLAKILRDKGVKLFDVTCGNPYFNPHVNRPFDHGVYTPVEHPMQGAEKLLNAAKALQNALPNAVIVATGLSWFRHFGANVAAGLVRDGWAKLAGFGRQSFAYPDFANDILKNGMLTPEKCCIACGNCTQIMRDGGRAGCMVRDRDVYLPIYRQVREGKPSVDMTQVAEHI